MCLLIRAHYSSVHLQIACSILFPTCKMYVFSTALQAIQKIKSAAAPRARAMQKFPEDIRLGTLGLAEQRHRRFPALCGSSAAAGGEGPWLWAPAGQEICTAEGIQKAEIDMGMSERG